MKLFHALASMALLSNPTRCIAQESNKKSQEVGRRRNAVGDFDEFNEIFENASIVMPDSYQVSERVALIDFDMTIENIKCYNISVGDIAITHNRVSDQSIDVSVGVYQLDLNCELDYSYKYGLLRGDGWLKLTTENNWAFTRLNFESEDFDSLPPSSSSVKSCLTDIEIENMDFEGDLVSEIIEIFQRLVRGTVERAIGNVACDELGSIGTTFFEGMIELADEKLEPYLAELGDDLTDPLYMERTVDLPQNLKALDLQDNEDNAVGKLFQQVLQGADAFLGTFISDSSSSSNERDLAINIFLRDNLLDEDRSLTIDVSELPIDTPVIFKGHDRIIETTMTLNQVKIFGIDSLSRFNPFVTIGKHTLQNELTWDRLTVEFDVTVDMKPSTLEDAILQDPTSPGISERILVDFGIDNLDVLASLLLLINEETLGSLELGQLLHSDHFLPCLLSVIHEVQLSGLKVDPKIINEPNLDGFISPGVDRMVSDSATAAFEMYTGVLKQAIPNIFESNVRDFMNTHVIDAYFSDADTTCPPVVSVGGLVNFQELFGEEYNTYGDLPPMLKNLFDSELLVVDETTGMPRINEVLVAPFTEMQSGVEGTLAFFGDLFGLHSETIPQIGMDSIELKAFDASIENLDTLGAPIELLKPNATNGFVLDNMARIGTEANPMRFALKGLLALKGDPVLETRNEVDVSVEIEESEVFASILAKIDSEAFSTFPLRDIVNLECWLATLAKPLMEGAGDLVDPKDVALALESILLSIPSMKFDFACTNCTSAGLDVIPEILTLLESNGISDVLEQRLVKVGLDLVQSDYVQAYLNRMVIEGSLRCPHSPHFQGESASSDFPVPSYPTLPYDSLESVVFASTLLLQMATVVVAESHKAFEVGSGDPLSGQQELSVDSSVDLFDFTSLAISLGEWVDIGLEQAMGYLSDVVDDPNGVNGKDLRINGIVRSTLLDENRLMNIGFNDISFGGDDMEVALKHVRVVGLDTISELNAMEILAPQTLSNKIKWKNLGVEIVITVLGNEWHKSKEDISLYLELSDVDISAALLLALDVELAGSLQLSSILEVQNILPCLLSTAQAAELTELQVAIGSIGDFYVNGFKSSELQEASTTTSRLVMETFGDDILASMPAIFDVTIRTMLNNWIDFYRTDDVACPISSFESSSQGFVDFRDLFLSAATSRLLGGSGSMPYGDLFSTGLGFVQDLFFNVKESTGLSKLNDLLITPLTESQSNEAGSLVFSGDLFSTDSRVKVGGLDTTIELKASNARIDNLNTVGAPLAFLEAIDGEAHQLNNTATLGVNDRPLSFAVRFLISLLGDDNMKVRNEMDIKLDLSNANVILKAMMKIAETRFYGFPLRDALDYNCWLATIPAPTLDSSGVRVEEEEAMAGLAELVASISDLHLEITCVECSSPKILEMTELLSLPEAQEDATIAMNLILEYISGLAGGNYLQTKIDRLLNEASRKCPHSPMYDEDFQAIEYEPFEPPSTKYSLKSLLTFGGLAFAVLLIIGLLVLFKRYLVRQRHEKWLARLPAHQVRSLKNQQNKEQKIEADLNTTTSSMFSSPEIPRLVRWGMPLVILCNIIFFLSGHLSLGATVNIEAELAGEKFQVDKFFEFSVARSTIDIWNAGGKVLAVLILVFSGIWPYTKSLLTLCVWFLPPSKLTVSRRGTILMWLDMLAKWSMIDIFVLVISIAAFRVSIASPEFDFLPTNFYSIDMLVVPLWGLYANMIAQILSQVSSHFIIRYHRRIVKGGMRARVQPTRTPFGMKQSGMSGVPLDEANEASDERMSLYEHRFGRPHRGETEKLVVRRGVNKVLHAMAFFLTLLVIIGCALPSFSLEVLGLIGVAIETGQDFEDANTQHSVFTVIQLLFEEARFLGTLYDYIGLTTLSVLVIFSVLLVPIIQSVVLLRQWTSSSTMKKKARMSVVIELLQAWQYAEVYLLAVFVASWQLGPVSEFMINSYCDSLKDIFAQAVHYGVLKEEDAQCFRVQSSIEGGSYMLTLAALLLAFVNTFVIKATVQYFRNKSELENKMLMEEDLERDRLSLDTSSSSDEGSADAGFSARIHPPPVLFTDTYRWMLRSETGGLPASSRAMFAADTNSTPQWGLPEATAVPFDRSMDGDAEAIEEGQFVIEDEEESISKASRPSKSDGSSSKRGSTRSMSSMSRRSSNNSVASAKRRLTYEDGDQKVAARSVSSRSRASAAAASRNGSRAPPAEHFQEEMMTQHTEYEEGEFVQETISDLEEYTLQSMTEVDEEFSYDGSRSPHRLT